MKTSLLLLALVLAFGASALAAPPKVPDAPSDMDGYDAYQGQAFHFMVTGTEGGSVWGTDIYTLDSRVAVAAMHAGLVKLGEEKEVAVLMLPGQKSYVGSVRNGVTSHDYGEYRASYRFLKPGEPDPDPSDGKHPLETPDNVRAFKPRIGEILPFKVTGAAEGNVWGTEVYTADSLLAAAAVHAGKVKPGETATVWLKILPGQKHYKGSAANGITSSDYDEFELSFRFEAGPPPATAPGVESRSQPTDKGTPPPH